MRLTIIAILCLSTILAACSPAATPTPQPTETAAPVSTQAPSQAEAATITVDNQPSFNTSIGRFEIKAAHWVNEVNGVTPGPDEKILVIELAKPGQTRMDPSTFSLEEFDQAIHDQSAGEVHLRGDDGSYTICTMAGWIGEKHDTFVMGFRTTKAAQSFQLFWPGNGPIEVRPK